MGHRAPSPSLNLNYMNFINWSHISTLLVCAFFILGLTACDSSDNDDDQIADFPGDPDMLGMWESLDETTGQPWDGGYQEFVEITYMASTGVTSARGWEKDAEVGDCWTLGPTETITNVTTTTIFIADEQRRYTADADRLAFYDGGVSEPDVLFRRSTRAPSSFTPEC